MISKKRLVLFKRELLDILRDKKTLVMMIVVPIILYPLMIIGMALIMTSIIKGQEDKTYRVAFYDVPEIEEGIRTRYKNAKEKEFTYDLSFVDVYGGESAYADALENEEIEAYVTKGEKDDEFEIHYLSAKNGSDTAARGLKDVFNAYRDDKRKELIEDAGLDIDTIFYPVKFDLKDSSTKEESVGNMLGGMMPFLIITVILLGAIYPSIDVTAGERERGTLETLLTLPVSNYDMIMSKFMAVSVIACVSAFLNVFSMGGAVAFLVSSSLASTEGINLDIKLSTFIPGLCFTVIVMMCFALLVTAVCMCVCIFAKNFKEANNYITPVMLIFMFGSYAAMLPDFELTTRSALIPIVNVSLLVRELFKLNYDYGLFAVVLISTVGYSHVAIRVLSRIYKSEEVLFGEGFKDVTIFNKRSDITPGKMPRTGDLMMVLSIVLILMFYLGSYAYAKMGAPGVAVQQGFVIAVPIFFAWYMKADHKRLFMLHAPTIKDLIGGVFIGAGAWPIAMIIGTLLSPIFKQSLENTSELENMIADTPTFIVLIVAAVMPAICEEVLFRGFTFGTLKSKYKPAVAVAATSIIFAAYHMSVIRFFALLPLSFALTYAAYKTDSIFVTMLMHLINNSFSLIQSKYPDEMAKILPMLNEGYDMSYLEMLLFVLISCAIIAVGVLLLRNSKSKELIKKEV